MRWNVVFTAGLFDWTKVKSLAAKGEAKKQKEQTDWEENQNRIQCFQRLQQAWANWRDVWGNVVLHLNGELIIDEPLRFDPFEAVAESLNEVVEALKAGGGVDYWDGFYD
jgi:hypothetical protein